MCKRCELNFQLSEEASKINALHDLYKTQREGDPSGAAQIMEKAIRCFERHMSLEADIHEFDRKMIREQVGESHILN